MKRFTFHFLPAFIGLCFLLSESSARQAKPGPNKTAGTPSVLSDRLAAAAPENCILYVGWDKAYDYQSTSSNATEKLMAEPEVQTFVDDMVKRIGLMAPAFDTGSDTSRTELLHNVGPSMAEALFKNRGCFFVETFKLDNNNAPKAIKAVLILNAGKNATGFAANVAKLLNLDPRIKADNGPNSYAGTINESIKVSITSTDKMVFIGFGDSVLAETNRRMAAGSIPNWLKEFKSGRGSKHISNVSYFNVSKIRSKLIRIAGREGAAAFAAMGLDNAESLESCTGLSENESFSRLYLKLDGRPEGILDISGPKGLLDSDLEMFPTDSLFAAGLSLDLRRAFGLFNTAILLMSNGRENLYEILEDIQRDTGIEVQQDIIANLGKSWTVYNGAGDGWLSGLTLTTSVKDTAKFTEVTDKIIKTVLKESRRDRYAPQFARRTIDDSVITSMTFKNMPNFVTPAWSIHDGRLIVGLFPQAVESAIKFKTDRANQESRLLSKRDWEVLTSSFASDETDTKLLAIGYVDTASNFELSYPYMQMTSSIFKSASSEFTRGMPEKVAAQVAELLSGIRIPRARVVHRHLEPSLLAVRQNDEGIEFETRQTIPSLDIGYAAPIAAGALVPAINGSRAAAKRVRSQNNLRQITLASLNYESAYMEFPCAYSVDADGKPLLSWRVHILPFMEQNELYEQFRLDEPWDSPNNIALLDKMPELFKAPSSNAESGKTVYRGIGGKSGVFQPATKGKSARISFGQITDGSSNTIFAIETSDAMAIEWTRPNGGVDPESFDIKQLFSNRTDGTNIAMCDGSVHLITDAIDPDVVKKMMTRNGGEITERPRALQNRRSRRSRRSRSEPVEIDQRFRINGASMLKLKDMLNENDREDLAADEAKEKTRQIALALLNYNAAYMKFPAAFSTDSDGKPLLSWRVEILPFMGSAESRLSMQFNRTEPWDSPHNKKLIEQMPDVFKLSSDLPRGKTNVFANGHESGLIKAPVNGEKNGLSFRDIADGASNTIMLLSTDADSAVEWTKPEEFSPTEEQIRKLLIGEPVVAFADGSVKALKSSFPFEKFKAMLTIAGGEVVRKIRDHVKD